MKPIKKEDMPKLIILIVLAVGMFVFALIQFMSNPAASVAATPPAPGTALAKGGADVPAPGTATGTAVAAAPTPPANPELDFLHIGPPAGGKDPFTPNGPAAPVVAPLVPAPVSRPLPPVAVNSSKGSDLSRLLGIRNIRPNGMDMENAKPGIANPLPAPVELPAPVWTVSGIVLAERDADGIKRGRDVAILRDAAGNRRFVTVGDPVDNGYSVSAVRPGGVEIHNKNRTALIRLESSSPAANPSLRPGGVVGAASGANGVNSFSNFNSVNSVKSANSSRAFSGISGINGANTRAN